MNQAEVRNLNDLNNNKQFSEVIEKLTTGAELSEKEKTYVLSIALYFLRYYDKNKKFTTYVEFAYYIILKYSTTYSDYKPLYDFSVEFGFFPIAKNILQNDLIGDLSIKDILIKEELNSFSYENKYIQTLEQFKTHNQILKEENKELAFIAPTSYGKSSTIVDLIKKYNSKSMKIGIIVPSKSLLIQTFNLLKREDLQKKFLLHDDMYNNDEAFIAIFTQERALRLLKNKNTYFDILFIDEAHNLFTKDSRSILLSRLIRRNLQANPESKIIYLSPLIQEANHLKVGKTQIINEQKINFNIKEPEIFEYLESQDVRQYNRFTGQFYLIGKENNYLSYIKNKGQNKNFLYLRAPRKVEELALELANQLSPIEGLQDVVNILNNNVHEDFYISKLLSKGVIYLHGKLPDIIKEYLEYKFKTISSLKYIVANRVILEGVNLPIDNMFILNVHSLTDKDLTNLIGRVNRLDTIFTSDSNNLNKLLPSVHFLNTDKYGRKLGKMENCIAKLRSRIFKDTIQNPTLESFDFEKLDEKIEKAKKEKDKALAIKEKERIVELVTNENYLHQESVSELDKLKKYFIENDINKYYSDLDDVLEIILNNIRTINEDSSEWKQYRLIDKIYFLFIKELDDKIQEYEFKRLEFEKTRNYYSTYIYRSHQNTLKENINHLFGYFKQRIKENNSEFYFGKSYGEIPKSTSLYDNYSNNVYVNLATKKDNELINLAIVKLQMEDGFISYTLNRFVEMMYDYELITIEEYNLHIYGTENPKNINLIKLGLNSNLIQRLESDNQLHNLSIDDYGNLNCNQEFRSFLNTVDDFYKFQISKFLI